MDIQRCSIHDGPGIRTTVFIKGCPLKCRWCHNPESLSYKKQLSFNKEKCIDCNQCEMVCPNGVHTLKRGIHIVDFSKCTQCGSCIDRCPTAALTMIGKSMSVQDIMKIIVKDRAFYTNSGGGVTISGGEPLSNSDFTLELLKECKKKAIHTCVETSGYCTTSTLKNLWDYIDLFLFDYKLPNREDYIEYTGVSNELILKNLELIYKEGKRIILRCPIIPTVNDNPEHFRSIEKILLKYPGIKVEPMPYHNFGISKSNNIGSNFVTYPIPTDDEKKYWAAYFNSVI